MTPEVPSPSLPGAPPAVTPSDSLSQEEAGPGRSGRASKLGRPARAGRPSSGSTLKGPIAVIGMSGRFPGAENPEEFWECLEKGEDLVEKACRWDLESFYGAGERACLHGGFLSGIDRFDPVFFKISGTEAAFMDPQQRLFLEESWKAMEDAGMAGESIRGARCGVYAGCSSGDYPKLFQGHPPATAFWGNSGSVIPARIAYLLDLKGPAVAVDTSCSSSLVAIHTACQALRTGEVDLALAGGVFIQSSPQLFTLGNAARMLSPGGRCRAFDHRADGFVPGEGVGVVVLRRLDQALDQGDHIYGVIRATGINQDGASNGITAPSARSQVRLETGVYEDFGIDPATITLVEAHGTGTELGDPIEFKALCQSFEKFTRKKGFCALGSVKTNIGHAATAAGIAGFIKILLCLKHGRIPPLLHFEKPNPRVGLSDSPFYVNTGLKEWTTKGNAKRRAAISGFGFSGTNAHLVIDEAPPNPRIHASKGAWPVFLSAGTNNALYTMARNLAAFCGRHPDTDLGDLAFTLVMGRKRMPHRLFLMAASLGEVAALLEAWGQGKTIPGVRSGEAGPGPEQRTAALERFGQESIEKFQACSDPSACGELLSGIGELFVQGYDLPFSDLFGPGHGRISLPVYPFARERYWVPLEPGKEPDGMGSLTWNALPDLQEREEKCDKEKNGPAPMDGLSVPLWNPMVPDRTRAVDPAPGENCLILTLSPRAGEALEAVLPNAACQVLSGGESVARIVSQMQARGPVDRLVWIFPTPEEIFGQPRAIPGQKEASLDGAKAPLVFAFRLAKALVQLEYGPGDLSLDLVTFRAHSVFPTDSAHPVSAGIYAFGAALAGEYPHWQVRLFDLEDEDSIPAKEMAASVGWPNGAPVARRGRQWFGRTLVPVTGLSEAPSFFRKKRGGGHHRRGRGPWPGVDPLPCRKLPGPDGLDRQAAETGGPGI